MPTKTITWENVKQIHIQYSHIQRKHSMNTIITASNKYLFTYDPFSWKLKIMFQKLCIWIVCVMVAHFIDSHILHRTQMHNRTSITRIKCHPNEVDHLVETLSSFHFEISQNINGSVQEVREFWVNLKKDQKADVSHHPMWTLKLPNTILLILHSFIGIIISCNEFNYCQCYRTQRSDWYWIYRSLEWSEDGSDVIG